MKKLLLSLSLLVALFPLNGFASTAHAASHLPQTSARPSWAASWHELVRSFWDPTLYGFLTIDGSLYLNAAYVSNPPTIDEQSMYAHIYQGGYYGVYPGTWDTINGRNGALIGTYRITSSQCAAPGYPDASTCGQNYSAVRPPNWSNCPVKVYHQWLAIDDNGVVLAAGNWAHPTNLC